MITGIFYIGKVPQKWHDSPEEAEQNRPRRPGPKAKGVIDGDSTGNNQ
jgi:hypothetical protein